jgi:hypothetical protein
MQIKELVGEKMSTVDTHRNADWHDKYFTGQNKEHLDDIRGYLWQLSFFL